MLLYAALLAIEEENVTLNIAVTSGYAIFILYFIFYCINLLSSVIVRSKDIFGNSNITYKEVLVFILSLVPALQSFVIITLLIKKKKKKTIFILK